MNYNGPKVDARYVPGPAPVRSDPEQCSWLNAGNTENPALPPDGGDKATGAVNQQERPLAAEWVVGFVDGEGCFSIPIFKNMSCRLGWQVQPEFAVVQGERSASVLRALEEFFGCGIVSVNRRRDNHRQDMWRYGVRRLGDLQERIVPFFEANPLRTAKALDFKGFAEVVAMMTKGDHLSMEGLVRIAAIAETTNRRKPSRLAESSEAIRQLTHLDG